MERSDGATAVRDKAKLALNAILQNIQALEVSFATKVLKAFREAAGEEAELGFDAAAKVLCSLDLSSFVEGGSETGLPLGSGEEWRRLWRLWKSEAHTVDEQLFLFLAWRGQRFCEQSFVKDIAYPLFLALDLDSDSKVSWADLQSLFRQGDTGVWSTGEEAERNIDLMQLLDYHAAKDEAAENKDPKRSLGFPSFLAWICDAQDTAAIRGAAQSRPLECVLRFDKWVVFMRPQDLGACVDPREEEEFDAVMGESPQQMALKAAKDALQEARSAKQVADAAQQAVIELVRSQPGTPNAQEENPSFQMPAAPKAAVPTPPVRSPLVQSMIEEAPLADAPVPLRKPVSAPPTKRLPEEKIEEAVPEVAAQVRTMPLLRSNLTEGSIEEAPVMQPSSPQSPRSKLEKKKSLRPSKKIQITVTDVKCKGCGSTIKSDSNFCRHCGMPNKARRSSTALRVEKTPLESAEDAPPKPIPNPRYCALDADTESLPMAETPVNLRNQSQEEEDWEESFCSTCGADYPAGANFCSNCGRKRERTTGSPKTQSSTRTPMTSLSPKASSSVKAKDSPSGYVEVGTSVTIAPSSTPKWTKISFNDNGGGPPTATVGLDMKGSGKPNVYIKGEDANRDGIPDVLQSEGTTILVQSPRGLSVKSDTSNTSTLQQPAAGSQRTVQALTAAPVASAPVAGVAVAAAGAAGAAGVIAISKAQTQVEEEEEYYDEDEEGEEEEGDFEDDPLVEVMPTTQANGASKR